MVASHDTIQRVFEVLREHLDAGSLLRVARQLEEVPGNQSFRESVRRLRVAADNRLAWREGERVMVSCYKCGYAATSLSKVSCVRPDCGLNR